MEAKKLLKKHLDIHIPKSEYRSGKQLIQLRYDASIDAINEALTIHSVSQQRELLIGFREWMRLNHYDERPSNEIINEYLKTN